MDDWVTIADAARAIGRPVETVRYWVNRKGLETQAHTPEIGHATTLVHMDDVLRMDEISKKRMGKVSK